jgi:redox-sensitive bicupin YhaK (pirin superfamily)
MVGEALGLLSPVQTRSPTLYLDLELPAGGELELPGLGRDAGGATIPGFELGIYAVNTDLSVNGAPLAAQHLAGLAGLAGDATLRVAAGQPARAVVIGGQALGHRHLQWNFVASRRERLLQAREDWAQQRFPLVPGDEDEFIPLPSS